MATLQGRLGRANWRGVWGWALDTSSPERKVTVEVLLNGEVVGQVRAVDPRPGLKIVAPEHRDCGFQFLFPNGLSALQRHVVQARVLGTSADLDDSPAIVEPDPGFDPALEQTLGHAVQVAVAGARTQSDLDSPLAFVADQIARLLEARRSMPGAEETPLPPELVGVDERWAGVLEQGIGAFPEIAEPGAGQRRVLVVGDEAPVLDDSARSLVAQVASLARLGLAVDFVAAEWRANLAAQVAAIEQAGAAYLRPPLSLSVEEVLRRNRGLYDAILLHRVTNAEKYAALARSYCPLARVIYSVDGLFFVRMLRRAILQGWEAGRGKGEALRQREVMQAWSANAVITHSVAEATVVRQAVPQASVHVIGWPVSVRTESPAFADRNGVAFIGDFQHYADIDAAAWVVAVLMPAVWASHPGIACVIAGCNVPDVLRQAATERVHIVEQKAGLAAEENPVLDQARVLLAPWRGASGLAAAVPAALAAGVPVAGTPVGLEALTLPEEMQRLVADDVPGLAAIVVGLHEDAAAHAAAAEAGRRLAAERFSAAAVDAAMLAVVGVAEPVAASAG